MIGSGDLALEVVSRFRSRLLEDRLHGEPRPLADYLDDVPRDQWALVARAWVEMIGEGPVPVPDTVREDADEVPAGDFGPYRLVRELGRGGQGTVYLAEDLRLGRKVALKVLEGWASVSETAIRRLRREAEVASRVDDPGICTVYETGVESGKPFIAMRYVEGHSLAQGLAAARKVAAPAAVGVVTPAPEDDPSASDEGKSSGSTSRRGRAAVLEVVALVERIARSLHAAHEAGILHRDIKPGNVMVTPSGEPVITDFGVARQEDSELPTLTRTGEVFGTPAYMSPEQLSGRVHDIDRRSDVWSLGVTLFECLALQRPFEAPTREGLYQAIQVKDPPDVCRLNRAVPGDLRTVLEKSLEKRRDARYATALDLAEELRRVRQHEPILARPVTRWLRLMRWGQRNPGVAASLTLGFLLLVTALIASLALLRSEQDRTAALEREAMTFARYRQTADPAVLRFLTDEAKGLWPRRPRRVREMEAWLEQACELRDRIAARMVDLAELRQRSLPPGTADSEEELRLQRARFPELMHSIDAAVDMLNQIEERIRLWPRRTEILEEEKEELRERLASLRADPRLQQRLVWRFSEGEDQQVHRRLAELEERRAEFVELIADVESRRSFALTIRERSIAKNRAVWDACLADLAASQRYGNLVTVPQVGLVPLGRDADSGLWEFWHVGSGACPVWEETEELSGKARIAEESGMVLVLLPGGTFRMGAQDADPAKPNFDPQVLQSGHEGPVREVGLEPFFIGKHEVTQGQWLRIMGTNPAGLAPPMEADHPATLAHPVEQVSWFEVCDFAHRLDLALPTTAQWEYAARAGTSTPWWTGKDKASLDGKVNLADATAGARGMAHFESDLDDGYAAHAPVGTFPANDFGLHEILGNVLEWCQDTGPALSSGNTRVCRGGGFDTGAARVRSTTLFMIPPFLRLDFLGARVAKTLDP